MLGGVVVVESVVGDDATVLVEDGGAGVDPSFNVSVISILG